jgi:signal transduction histidine kinase/DNA-binding response OmpR family regulator
VDFPLRILMLEDVATDAELVEYELRRGKLEFSSRRAQTQAEFEAGLRDFQPALILADYSLPTFDGSAALALAQRFSPEVPFIFVSGAIGEERAIEALRSGATDYVLKDRLSRLVPAVRRALQEVDERKRRQQAEESLRAAVQVLAVQAQRLQILHDVDQAVLAARSVSDIAAAVVERVRHVLPCQQACVILFDFDAYRGRVLASDSDGPSALHTGATLPLADLGLLGEHWPDSEERVDEVLELARPARLDEMLAAEGMHSYLRLSLRANGHLIGTLSLAAREPSAFGPEDERTAGQLADSLAVAIQNTRLHEEVAGSREQLQYLSRRLVEVQENERRHVARELHDEAAQGLTALIVKLSVLERDLHCVGDVAARMTDVKQLAAQILEGLHDLAVNLRPVSLDKLGLVPALRQYADQFGRQYGIGVQVEAIGLNRVRLPAEVEIAFYRIVQESLTNVARHSRATNVAVILEMQGAPCPADAPAAQAAERDSSADGSEPEGAGRLLAIIEDNGVGFDPAVVGERDRLGLFGMRERARALGGKLTIESSPGSGTTLYVEVPCGSSPDRG